MLSLTGVVLAASMAVGQAEEPDILKLWAEDTIGTWVLKDQAEDDLPGMWKKGDILDIEFTTKWALKGGVLQTDYQIKNAEGQIVIRVKGLSGWDPSTEKIKAVWFGEQGGLGQWLGQRVGAKWVADRSMISPSNIKSTATMTSEFPDPNTRIVIDTNRVEGDKKLPDRKVVWKRK